MGLSPLDAERWIEPDDQLPRYYRNKLEQRRLLGERVYRALPEARAAALELQQLLLEHLRTNHPNSFQLHGGELRVPSLGLHWPVTDGEPLWQASLWVQDDLCLLQPSPQGYRLVAASLCAASHWRLEDKLGGSLAQIHGPIPGIATELQPAIDRFFAHIKVERPVWRGNWALTASNELNQRDGSGPPVAADSPIYLRVERQSLRRLPISGAVVFTIRVYQHPLALVQGNPGAWEALAAALRGLTVAEWDYKAIDTVLPALNAMGMDLARP